MKLLMFFASLSLLTPSVFAQETNSSLNAPIVENNPTRVTFQAVLQSGKPVSGQITGVSNDNGTGVNLNLNFFNFPDVAVGPFNYHIHQYPVSSSGNCTAAGPHLSPFGRADTPPCDALNPQTCQPGDLSGKHGNISQLTSSSSDGTSGGTFQARYLDLYLSTDPSNVAYFGNRSVVVHAANGTRLNCGNFTQMMPTESFGGTGNGSGSGSATTGTTGTTTPTGNSAVSGPDMVKTGVVVALSVAVLTVAIELF